MSGRPVDVKGPDGKITRFPDGTPDAKIDEVMSSIYAAPAPKPDNSAARGFTLGSLKPVDNIMSAVSSGARAIGLDGVSDYIDAKNASHDQARKLNTRTGFQTAGNIVGTAPLAALTKGKSLGGVAAVGGGTGALLSDAKDPVGLALDTSIGALGSVAGDRLIRGVAGAIAPKVTPYVQKLRDAGVKLTPGQVAREAGGLIGGIVSRAEDAFTSLPGVGTLILNDRNRGIEQFARSRVKGALDKINVKLPDSVATGHDAIDFAQQEVSKAYQAILPQAQGAVDQTFLTRTAAAKARANLPAQYATELDDVTKREVGALFDQGGNYNGKRLGQVVDRLDKIGSGYRKSEDPYKREIGDAIGKMRENVLDLVRRNNPQAGAALRDANAAYALLIRSEKAAVNTPDGVFTPNQYRQAVTQADRSIRRRGVAAGRALDQQDAKAAAAVLPSKLADSGTFTRFAQANTPSAIVGGLMAIPYAAARAAVPLTTRNAGPGATYAAQLVRRAAPVSLAAPALLRRPDQ